MSKWISFELLEHPKKVTSTWAIRTNDGIHLLGCVKWYGSWRGYAFFPTLQTQTIFEQQCLRDIANFIEQENKAHREKRKAEKNNTRETA